jgi:hypothetical protein
MTDHIKGVLLIPNGDHAELLLEGVGGSRPPRAWHGGSCWLDWVDPDNPEPDELLLDGSEALILAWDGTACELGCYHAAGWDAFRLLFVAARRLLQAPSEARFAALCMLCPEVGTLVFVDADGLEVARV